MNSTNLISTSDTWTSAGKILLNQATLFSLTLLIPCALQAETKTLVAAGTITVSREKGRAVFSNDGTPAIAPKALVEKALPSENGGVRETALELNTGFIGSSATPREVDDAIEQAARRHNVDANLVRALIRVESNFNSKAVSRKGAMGLMQLMPSTARQLKVTNPFDPDQNVDAGVRHLKQLLQDFNGNVKLSLAAYNAGAGAVHRNAGIPNYAETRNYVSRITSLYNNGDTSPFRSMVGAHYEPHYEPMRISRDSMGVLTVTNTDPGLCAAAQAGVVDAATVCHRRSFA